MKKYYIGMLIIGLITLGLAGYVLNIGMQGKQDKKTYEKAQEIAEKLNDHVSKEQAIPESLNDVGVSDVPSTIKYERLSSKQYKFCTTYKTDKGYGSGDITGALTGAALSGMYSGSYDSTYQNDNANYLFVSYTYKKGETCQTIEPTLYNFDSSSGDSLLNTDSVYNAYCGTAEDRARYSSYCESLQTGEDSFGSSAL